MSNHQPLVTLVTPTYGRSKFLKRAIQFISQQTHTHYEWLIWDDSPEKFDFNFSSDPRIKYFYDPIRLSIGEKRNRLNHLATGKIIIHIDDDDYYSPTYVKSMLTVMEKKEWEMINLRSWFLYDYRSKFFGYWNLEKKTGRHFKCAGAEVEIVDIQGSEAFKHNHLGFGCTYAYKKEVWDSIQFPDMNWGEDAAFAIPASEKFKVGGIHDNVGIFLHFLHMQSTSRCFPQYQLPDILIKKFFSF